MCNTIDVACFGCHIAHTVVLILSGIQMHKKPNPDKTKTKSIIAPQTSLSIVALEEVVSTGSLMCQDT
jgi:hypothetical protein